jgi:polysaccharide pyruvyl transferase WcaK-like protein
MLRTTGIVVATRLHGAVLPLAEGVPAVGFAVSPKLPNFFSTMGIGRYCLGPDAWPGIADWLAEADHATVFAEQRQALARSCVWTGKAGVRKQLALLARAARDGYAGDFLA